MKRLIFLASLTLVTACKSEGEKAEERFQMVERNKVSDEEVCAAARDVAKVYLQARDDDQYPRWKMKADQTCLDVTLEGLSPGSG